MFLKQICFDINLLQTDASAIAMSLPCRCHVVAMYTIDKAFTYL